MDPKRNEQCPCGSGKKYKVCCGVKQPRSHWWTVIGAVAFLVMAAWAVVYGVMNSGKTPEGLVWHEEHGHYHRVAGAGEPPVRPPSVPADAVWSSEHGHYHDADGQAIDVGFGEGGLPQ